MKRTIGMTIALTAFVAVIIVLGVSRWRETQASQALQVASHEIPKFQVDPSWPKLPSGWVLGPVASASVDDRDHVWVLHRPAGGHVGQDVRAGQRTGPPVLEFDAAGNYVQGWGGPGEGYTWPQTSHGIHADSKGFVWIIGGGRDDQILKFTKTGKFVSQIGRAGQKDRQNPSQPQGEVVYSKTNELFISDNYGGGRVIVFDADTGAFKRSWGAFGNTPLDTAPPRPTIAPEDHIPAKETDPEDPGPQHFDGAHSVEVSNDGLVYVSDRGGKRVQVFTIEGKYVTQVLIDRWSGPTRQWRDGRQHSLLARRGPAVLVCREQEPGANLGIHRKTLLEPLDSFGRPGVAPGEFYVTHHMTTDSKGNLYTSENEDGRRVQKFTLTGRPPTQAN